MYHSGRFKDAAAAYERAQSLQASAEPTNVVLLNVYGDALWRAGRTDDAVSAWRRAADLAQPADPSREVLRRKLTAAEKNGQPELTPVAPPPRPPPG